ncbi:hypothetical protein MUB15_33535 [Priestia sp. OVS21]|nr:hypothetical protein [Priestia sp. OVS21]MCJ7992891.1 hypothetical protein [Priestia sp. OVS21]MCJ7992903.1 hypothetical protein [Priestia sp. OVS21]MCJ7992921.1 hypothetical protein [Priestia sp. OVS21]MCJ7992932.1 hypothetical protein [Priestia sp. OVS21]
MPKKQGPRCCSEFNEIRNFYLQASAAGFQQIRFEIDLIDPATGLNLEIFVNDFSWFIDGLGRCEEYIILTNIGSPLGVADSQVDCNILNAHYVQGSLQMGPV